MHLSTRDVHELNNETLYQFLSKKIGEGQYLDYKKALSGDNKETQYREFLKDISAFANAGGGDIFIGVKEPEDAGGVSDQIVGIINAEDLVDSLERVAVNSLDPRIPGLVITALSDSNKQIIIVHIPPSTNKPHMVVHGKTRTFYIRHNKSSLPMNTQDLRNTILNALNNEERIEEALAKKREQLNKYYTARRQPAFVIQAIPAVPLQENWDTTQQELKSIVGTGSRGKRPHSFDLVPNTNPQKGLGYVSATYERKGEKVPYFRTEVCDDGQISVVYNVPSVKWNPYTEPEDLGYDDLDRYLIHPNLHNFIRAFGDIVQSCRQFTKVDLPYVFKCTLFSADAAAHEINDFEEPTFQELELLEWPQEYVAAGESCEAVSERIISQLKYAFNLG